MTDAVDQTMLNFPFKRTCPYAPPPEYGQLREAASATRVGLPSGARAWAVARYEDVRAVLSDPRFSSDRSHPGFPLLLAGLRPVVTSDKPAGGRKISPFSLLSMDPPEHGQARRAVLGQFTLRHLQPLRGRIQQIVDDCVDGMLAGPRPADLVAALSLPVPSLVICELLGVPYGDHDFFQERAVWLLRRTLSAEERGPRHRRDEVVSGPAGHEQGAPARR
jgi:cytochrome P450